MSEYKNGGNNNMLCEQGVPGSNPAFFVIPHVSQVSSRIFGRGLKNRQPTFP